jgi:hypothetical protein
MQAFSNDKETNFVPLLNAMALYFQIRDDFINLVDDQYQQNKSFCEDLTEGKFSFPIIHCIQQSESGHVMAAILKQRTEERSVKEFAVALLRESGSLEYTRQTLDQLREEVFAEIQKLGGHSGLVALVEHLDAQIKVGSLHGASPAQHHLLLAAKALPGRPIIDKGASSVAKEAPREAPECMSGAPPSISTEDNPLASSDSVPFDFDSLTLKRIDSL